MTAINGYNADEVSLIPDFIRAYRAWHLDDVDLNSLVHSLNVSWISGRIDATCARTSWVADGLHEAGIPDEKCTCGFYGSYSPFGYYRQAQAGWRPSTLEFYWQKAKRSYIHGSFKATGRTVLATQGLRAGCAEVEAFALRGWSFEHDLPDDQRQHIMTALEPFGVPIFERMEDLVEQFPPANMSGLVEVEEPEPIPSREEIEVAAAIVTATALAVTSPAASGCHSSIAWAIPTNCLCPTCRSMSDRRERAAKAAALEYMRVKEMHRRQPTYHKPYDYPNPWI